MRPYKYVYVTVAILFSLRGLASTGDTSGHGFSFSGYAEGYYTYDFSKPADKLRPPFLYSFNRHNEPNVNIAMVKGSFTSDRFRANAALMAGTYSRYNLAQEPGMLKNIYEANMGVRIGKKRLWLDAGVMASHLGFESAIGKDCWSLTRSIMAENSPYFETGFKLGYDTENSKWYLALLMVNGWQRIKPVQGNSLPSFAHQLQYKPSSRLVLNSSSFIGTDKPDSARKMRYFHGLYGIYKLNEKLAVQMAFDIGAEQRSKGSSSYSSWSALVAGMRYSITKNFHSAVRFEYYSDPDKVIISSKDGLPVSTMAYSLNVDYQFFKWMLWRAEIRGMSAKDDIYFTESGVPTGSNLSFTTSLAIYF